MGVGIDIVDEDSFRENEIVAHIPKKNIVEHGLPKLRPGCKILGWSNKSAHLLIGRVYTWE